MKIPIYQIDAFAEETFQGNPAAVCPLKEWLPDEIMQSIAEENNLSETVFFVSTEKGFHIRWFTPVTEVDLCGHATLAAAYVLFDCLGYPHETIVFESRSGLLNVIKKEGGLVMNFPARLPCFCDIPLEIGEAFDAKPIECLKADDYIVVFEHESDVLTAAPDPECLKKLDLRGVIITSKSSQYDFIARFFAPKYGIIEDPVTGSAYTQLAPYWSAKMGQSKFRVKQVSRRGGELRCEVVNDRINIYGKAIKYLQGEIEVSYHSVSPLN